MFLRMYIDRRPSSRPPAWPEAIAEPASDGETSLRTAVTKSATCDAGIAQLYATSLIGLSCNKISA